MFFPNQFFGPLFYIFPSLILVAIIALVVVLAVRGRHVPDPLGRRVEAVYLFSTIFAIGLLGLGAVALTAGAVGSGISGQTRCEVIEREIMKEVTPGPRFTVNPFPEFRVPSIPEFRFSFQPIPQPEPSLSPASAKIRPQGPFDCPARRAATAQGVRGAMYLGAAAIGVVWFGNRASELLAKEKADDA